MKTYWDPIEGVLEPRMWDFAPIWLWNKIGPEGIIYYPKIQIIGTPWERTEEYYSIIDYIWLIATVINLR